MEQTSPQLSKKERRELKRQQKEESRLREGQERRMQGIVRKAVLSLVAVGVMAGIWWLMAVKNPANGPPVVEAPSQMCVQHGAQTTMHIHPRIKIFVKGEEKDIPSNIGIPTPQCMRPIHTHDTSGTIHLEFPEERDVELGEFFKIWEKEFSSTCIFDFCNGADGNVKMTVNGEPNEEFETYMMKDQDNIIIRYE